MSKKSSSRSRITPAARTIVALAIAVVLAPSVLAIEPTALPEFQVTTAEGHAAKSAELISGKENTLIIYVQAKSHYCDQLLKMLTRKEYPNVAPHAVIIVQGTLDDLKAMRAQYSDLSTASWYSDSSRKAFTQLKLHGVPVIVGVNQQKIQWSLNGILPDDKILKSILNSWTKS